MDGDDVLDENTREPSVGVKNIVSSHGGFIFLLSKSTRVRGKRRGKHDRRECLSLLFPLTQGLLEDEPTMGGDDVLDENRREPSV